MSFEKNLVCGDNDNVPMAARLVFLLNLCLISCLGTASISRFHQNVYNATFHVPWKALEDVDGFKNENMVLMISGTSARNFLFLRERYSLRLYVFIALSLLIESYLVQGLG